VQHSSVRRLVTRARVLGTVGLASVGLAVVAATGPEVPAQASPLAPTTAASTAATTAQSAAGHLVTVTSPDLGSGQVYVADDNGNFDYGYLNDPGAQRQEYTTDKASAPGFLLVHDDVGECGATGPCFLAEINGGTDCLWADANNGPVEDTGCKASDWFEIWFIVDGVWTNVGIENATGSSEYTLCSSGLTGGALVSMRLPTGSNGPECGEWKRFT
jgi:hypothetical protein